ncbi:TetR family transcriptional regulator [Rhodococcus sp. PAM 2766]|uniref:TetR family transcriptional regulator n=1 Tax=Rhodococcus parequi TaxID=3137122 RepID=A0ABW9FI68_9NOCA
MNPSRRSHYARGRERRMELVAAAIAVIAEKGLERVTFRAVADRAGFPPSTTSYFFDSVPDVIDAAITQIADAVTDKVATLLTAARSETVGRDELAEALVELVTGQDNDDSVAQFEAYLAARRRPELAEAVHRIMGAIEEATERALEMFGVENPALPARQFVALIDGFTLHEIARPGDPVSRVALRDSMIRLLESHLSSPATSR